MKPSPEMMEAIKDLNAEILQLVNGKQFPVAMSALIATLAQLIVATADGNEEHVRQAEALVHKHLRSGLDQGVKVLAPTPH